MSETESIFQQLSKEEFDTIKALATEKKYGKGELIFSEGDTADYIYFIV